jgi:hypothetical protein
MLTELIPATEIVEIAGNKYAVGGLSFRRIAELLSRFPTLARAFSGNAVALAEVMASSPDTTAAIMAMGLAAGGTSGVTEEQCDALPAAIQLEIVSSVLGRTFPKGTRPFVECVTRIMSTLNISVEQEQTTTSQESSQEPVAHLPVPMA